MEEVNVVNKKSNSGYMSSIMFFVVVVVISIGLNLYNNSLVSDIETIKKSISSIETNIAEVEKNEELQIYSLLEINKKVIEAYENMNKITKYISHMSNLETKYNLEFGGFDISKGVIKTNVKAMSDDNSIAYQKTTDFIKKYRLDSNALFDLGFINTVEGMDIMKFDVNFNIK